MKREGLLLRLALLQPVEAIDKILHRRRPFFTGVYIRAIALALSEIGEYLVT